MEDIIKIIAVGLIAVIIVIIIKQYKPEFAIYISIITGAILQNISSKAGVNSQFLSLLLKITGIAFLAEFAINICKDAGEGAIASKIEIGSKVIIVSMSIPIISSLLDVILKLL